MDVQYESILQLASDQYDFTWILPGHGRMIRFNDVDSKNDAIRKAAKDFEAEDELKGSLSFGF